MATRRQRQVAELLHEELSQIIQFESRDPRLGFVTVTGVDVNPDLRFARVFVSVLGDDDEVRSTLTGLVNATQFYRHRLRENLTLRYIPELQFKVDNSFEHGMRIDQILDEIRQDTVDIESDSETEVSD
ncbi:MAG: 30S ribosome-binding factor RbfA [Anaerolineaceae bacterium]|nr:30S ribosome-binding factor RbfA [Anaerolineaceae bacterium]MCB9098464.1 30S ribosome-binding factor RbfA [Anaerolineales bacterium]